MAKTAQTAAASKSVAVQKSAPLPSKKQSAPVPAYLQQHLEKDHGRGVSLAAEDGIVPFIRIIQQLSPEIKKNHEKFIKGAEVGDIYLKGALDPIVKGDDGIVVQPCAFEKCWVEWVPRSKGGGFVARHKAKPSDVIEKPNPEDPSKTKLFRRSTGNEVIETRYHFVRHEGAPYVIGFQSTGHTTSREWTNKIKLLAEGGPIVAFSRKYKLTTKIKTKNDQEWYLFNIADAGWVESEEEYMAGSAFAAAIESGMKVAEDEEMADTGGGRGGDTDEI